MTEQSIRKLLALLGTHEMLRAPKGWLIASCPYAPETHERGTDNDPSFRVHINQQGFSGFYCHSCHSKGNMLDLVYGLAAQHGRNYNHLAALAIGWEVPGDFGDFDDTGEMQSLHNEEIDPDLYFAMYPLAWEDEKARAYLISRLVGKTAADEMDLRYDPERKRIMFPVFGAERQLYGFQGRYIYRTARGGPPKTYNYPPLTVSNVLLGEHLMRAGAEKVVVEGLFAYAHLIAIGAREFCDPVATLGSRLYSAQAGRLIAAGCKVHLLYDDDAAGTEGIYGQADRKTGKFIGGGALDMLRGEVQVTVPVYSACSDGDPDNLSLGQLENILVNAVIQ